MDCFGQSPRNDEVGCFASLRGMSKANDEAIYNNEKRKISQWNFKSLELQSFVKFNVCGIMDCFGYASQ